MTGEKDDHVVSETVLEDVRVLAIDQVVSMDTNTEESTETLSDVVETVTLEVTPNQAEAIAVADRMGRLSLALRSRIEGEIAEIRRGYSADFVVSRFLGGEFAVNNVAEAEYEEIPIFTGDGGSSGGQVRVYRSTTPQDMNFSDGSSAIP